MFENNTNNPKINQQNLDSMLKQAGDLGTSPAQFKQQVSEGNVEQLIKNLPTDKAKDLNDILSDPQKTKQVLDSPQAKMLMKLLFGGNPSNKQ